MICKRSFRFFVIFLTLVIMFPLCCGVFCVDSYAVVNYTQMSQSDTRSLLGDRIPFNYVVDGVSGSDTFVYTSDYCGLAQTNIGSNPCFTSGSQTFVTDNWLVYTSETNNYGFMNKLCQISFELDMYASSDSQFYGCFALPITQAIYQSPISADNSFSSYPLNFVNGINDCPAAPFADNSPNNGYYNTAIFTYRNMLNNVMSNTYFRLYPYENQTSVTALLADGVTFPYQRIVLLVYCPYVYGSLTNDNPALVTTSTTSGSSSGSGQTIINNNVDLTETHSILGGISNFLEDIWEAIRGIPSSILQGIQGIFVPEDGYFDSKVAQVKAKFSWYEDIVDAWTELKTALNGISSDTPPSITLSLDNCTFYGQSLGSVSGTALVLDWMFTYRDTIRNLLSAFMWIFFIWRLYCHIPNIISGSGMEVQKTDEGAAWTIHGHKL